MQLHTRTIQRTRLAIAKGLGSRGLASGIGVARAANREVKSLLFPQLRLQLAIEHLVVDAVAHEPKEFVRFLRNRKIKMP